MNIKERIKEFSELIKKYPDLKELYMERAKLYDEIKDYKNAVEDFKKAYFGYYACEDIMTVCEKAGLIKEAERLYSKAINIDKNNVYNYIKRIHFYIRIGEIAKAVLDCKTVLKLSPKDETLLILHRILTKKQIKPNRVRKPGKYF